MTTTTCSNFRISMVWSWDARIRRVNTVNPFSEGRQNQFWQRYLHLKCIQSIKQIEPFHDKTNNLVYAPSKDSGLGICSVWSEFWLCAHWIIEDSMFLHAQSEDSGQTERMLRLVFARRKYHFVVFFIRRIKFIVHLDTKADVDVYITKTCIFKYTENVTTKKWKFSDKKFRYFSYFCSKHRLWVPVRTASKEAVPTSTHNLCLSRNKKNNVYPCKPQFYYIYISGV